MLQIMPSFSRRPVETSVTSCWLVHYVIKQDNLAKSWAKNYLLQSATTYNTLKLHKVICCCLMEFHYHQTQINASKSMTELSCKETIQLSNNRETPDHYHE
jgi:hypothetical protein